MTKNCSFFRNLILEIDVKYDNQLGPQTSRSGNVDFRQITVCSNAGMLSVQKQGFHYVLSELRLGPSLHAQVSESTLLLY